jgi:hypothetical protein
MLLRRLNALPLLLLAVVACSSDVVAPERAISAEFSLVSINGRRLPTYLAVTPGPSATIFWAQLSLDKSGKAVMTEHRQLDPLGTEGIFTSTSNYRLRGTKIEIGSFTPCPINAICLANHSGTLVGSRLDLQLFSQQTNPIIYQYQGVINP